MTSFQIMSALALIAFMAVVFVYILVRAGSIAYYRTRSEYDRGELPTDKKRNEDHA